MNPFGQTTSTTPTIVPTAVAQAQQSAQTQSTTQSAGADLLSTMTQQRLDKLYTAQDALNKEIGSTIKAASTPVPISGTQGIKQPQLHGWTPIPIDTRTTYSRAGANRQGVANMIRGAANVVGSYIANKKNQEQKLLAVDIQRVLEAHNGIETAKEALQQNPNDAAAKAAIQKNTEIIDSLLVDPKKRKQIGKAFDINFIDPSENNKPEHAALKTAAQKLSYAQQLENKLPTQMGQNQVAQQRLGQLTDLGKTISDQIKAVSADKIMEAELRYQTEQDKILEKQQEESDKVKHWQDQSAQKSDEFQQKLAQQSQIAAASNRTRLTVAGIQANSRLAAVDRTIQGRIEYAKSRDASDAQMAKVLTGAMNAYQAQAKDLATEKLQVDALYNDKNASPQDKQAAQKRSNDIDEQLTYIKSRIDSFGDQITLLTGQMVSGGDFDNGSTTGNSTTNGSSNKPAVQSTKSGAGTTEPKKPTTTVSKPAVHSQPDEDKSDQDYLNIITEGLKNS